VQTERDKQRLIDRVPVRESPFVTPHLADCGWIQENSHRDHAVKPPEKAAAAKIGRPTFSINYTLLNSSQPATIPSGAGPWPAAASQAASSRLGCGSAALWGGQSWPQPPFRRLPALAPSPPAPPR
jgi:hypothetical protein